MKNNPTIKIAMADDHVLLRNALASLIDSFGNCRVIYQCNTGKELTNGISSGIVPDLVLLDLNMPDMDGFETAVWLQKNAPQHDEMQRLDAVSRPVDVDQLVTLQSFDEQPPDSVVILDDQDVTVAHGSNPKLVRSIKSAT